MGVIESYHAHVYFDEDTLDQARALCERAAQTHRVEMGRIHEKLVGPHPRWSCQLAFDAEAFASVVPWLCLNRDGLVVFVHPNTGDVVRDHAEHALWMGDWIPLNLDALE